MRIQLDSSQFRIAAHCLMLSCLYGIAVAQSSQPTAGLVAPSAREPDVFDVVSIKRSTRASWGGWLPRRIQVNPTALYCENCTLLDLIREAYDADTYQVVGVPRWGDGASLGDKEAQDVQAKTAEAVSREKMRSLLRALLADRFKLRLRQETQEMAGYHLVVAKGGLKLRRADSDRILSSEGPGLVRLNLDAIARQASLALRVKVQNLTGIDGEFIWRLFSSPTAIPLPDAGPVNTLAIWDAKLADGGLRLIAAKVPVQVIIVETADHPDFTASR